MEHRCSVRKSIEFQLLMYKHGLPMQIGVCRNLALGGLFIETSGYQWRNKDYLEVEIIGNNGQPLVRLPAMVVHRSRRGAGLVFGTLSNEQRHILRGRLFAGREARPTRTDVIEQSSHCAVA